MYLCAQCRRPLDHVEVLARAVEAAGRAFDVEVSEVLGRRRYQPVAQARQMVMWLLRREGLSYPQIGAVLDRDHSTVMYGVDVAERLLADPEWSETAWRAIDLYDRRGLAA